LTFTPFESLDFAVKIFLFPLQPFFLLRQRRARLAYLRFGFGAEPERLIGRAENKILLLRSRRFQLQSGFRLDLSNLALYTLFVDKNAYACTDRKSDHQGRQGPYEPLHNILLLDCKGAACYSPVPAVATGSNMR
jgi:hypothetical protein